MTTATTWPWLMLIALGAFHGINPAMGWLFAVALGLHQGHRRVVLWALIPLAFGHAVAIAATITIVASLGLIFDTALLGIAAGLLLIGWGLFHILHTPRHRFRVGMRAGFLGLTLWSCLMGLAHGAGLMLVPVFTAWPGQDAVGPLGGVSGATALAALGVHMLALIMATGFMAVLVYECIGVSILRRGWVNLDWVWAAALIITGSVVLIV